MASIFLSHASQDKKWVKQLAKDLRDLNHNIWLDEWNIKGGESIPKKISEGLESSDYVVVILSKAASKSNWVEVEWQTKYWEEIESNKVMVIPVLIEECKIPKLLKHKKYIDFRTNYALGLVNLTSSINPTIPTKTNLKLKKVGDKTKILSTLIEKIQSKNEPLSKNIAQVLIVAKEYNLKKIETFCKGELTGWKEVINNKDDKLISTKDSPKHRLIEAYLSPFGQVNLNYVGWAQNPSLLFDYMARKPKEFYPQKMVIGEPVSEIEEKALDSPKKGLWTFSMSWKYFVKKTDKPDAKVFIYAHGKTYIRLIESIRSELTKLLIDELPSTQGK